MRLYKKGGSYNQQIKNALDKLINKLNEKGDRLLNEYSGTHIKLLIDFKCSHEPHLITPNDYNSGYGCPRCAGLSPLQAEVEFKRLLKKNGHTQLSEYKSAKIHVLIDFNCGHTPHLLKPNNYKSGYGCPKCSRKCSSQAKENFYQEILKAGYKVLGEYKSALSSVKVQCDKGHIFNTNPNNFTSSKHRCSKCTGQCPIQAKEELIKLIKENGHELFSEYRNTNSIVLIDFKCGHDPHWIKPFRYKQRHGCPICKESRGERAIREYLESNRIEYICQYRFPDKNKVYDFYLPLERIIVEVHGLQHYEKVHIFHRGHKTFEDEKLNDRNKEEYAKEMGCKYLVVDYREHNPQLALERFIDSYNLMVKGAT
ncbi:hypothetical protein [Bacillus sp. SM2101]|uniref:hypothetical protein n=1 Tax=Bacillus sp. SM2101 TaxID=2805366 RepID=UPI00332BFCA7